MFELTWQQGRKWWSRPILATLAICAVAGSFEWIYEGHTPEHWRVTYVLMAITSSIVGGVFTNIQCRERRTVLLRMLPVPSLWPAINRVMLPTLLFALGCTVTLGIGAVAGAFSGNQFGIQMLAFMAGLLTLKQFELAWMELRPRLRRIPAGNVLYFVLPGIVGAVFGFLFAAADFDFTALLDQRFLWTNAALAALLATLTVTLYLRRKDYSSRPA